MLTQPALSALLGWLYYGEAFTPRDWTGAAMIVRRADPGPLADAGAALARAGRRSPISAIMPTPLEALRLQTGPRRWRACRVRRLDRRRRSTAPLGSSASTRRRRGSPFPRSQAAHGRRLDRGRRRGDGGAFHARADRRHEDPRPDPGADLVPAGNDGAGARGGAQRRCRSSPCRRIVPLALRIGWRSADLMWRIAGDTATDYNHYTKRLILSGVYGSTLLAWLDDQSEDWSETARLPRPPPGRRDAVRKMEGGVARQRPAPAEPDPLPRAPALSGALNALPSPTRY